MPQQKNAKPTIIYWVITALAAAIGAIAGSFIDTSATHVAAIMCALIGGVIGYGCYVNVPTMPEIKDALLGMLKLAAKPIILFIDIALLGLLLSYCSAHHR
jgi:zinc transporter ZupT